MYAMDSLSRIKCLNPGFNLQLPGVSALTRSRGAFFLRSSQLVSALRAGPPSVNDVDEDVLQMFYKERELNGDFISKASNLLWLRKFRNYVDPGDGECTGTTQQPEQIMESNDDGGFLKLSTTRQWLSGDNPAPINKKVNAKAAISYLIGVLFSCLYLQLLYQHADNLSSESVPQIFLKKKRKKIGIRSEDLQDFLERSIKGSGISLSSPRLVIPAAIFGLWVLSHRYFATDLFDFQLVPAMFGMFVYKAAVLVQVYRDNEDLQFVFPENEDGKSD